jgi:hypothetical protein
LENAPHFFVKKVFFVPERDPLEPVSYLLKWLFDVADVVGFWVLPLLFVEGIDYKFVGVYGVENMEKFKILGF